MPLREDVQRAVRDAMKRKDVPALETVRLLWSAIRNEEIDRKGTLDDDGVQAVATRQVKQLSDALSDFQKGGRADLVAKTEAEIALLSQYLPEQMGDDDVREICKRVIAATGAVGVSELGKTMGAVMRETKGAAEGNRVRAIVAELLGPPA